MSANLDPMEPDGPTLGELIDDLLDRHRGYRYSPILRMHLFAEIGRVTAPWAERFGIGPHAIREAIQLEMRSRFRPMA